VSSKTVIHAHPGAKRPRYFAGRLLTPADLELEQQYVDGQLRHLTRAALGTGIIDGLVVSASANAVAVSPGLAVDPLGRLVELSDTCTASLPASTGAWDVFVAIDQEPCDLRPAIGPEPDPLNEPGALRDVVRVYLHDTLPFAERMDEGSAVWLGRVRCDKGKTRVEHPKRVGKGASRD
jgi:hypothetical protein